MFKFTSLIGMILVTGYFTLQAEIPTGVTFETFYDIDKINFDQPTFVGAVPADPDQLIVLERSGKAFRLIKTAGVYEKKAWFSLDADTTTHWDGAWVVEFHPNFSQNHLFYVLFRQKNNGRRSVIEEWKVDATGLTNPTKVRPIIEFNQVSIHSSGDVKFGPDGFLYSSQGDRNQYEKGGPLMSELWGKVIRIDVNKKDPGLEYAIPIDNPFRTQAGARPEIFALGFRMPWRMSFDKLTKDLWLGDVGDLLHEEVNVVQMGKNYGAGVVEGKCEATKCATMIDPVLEQARTDGACIIGGFVYRADPTSKFYGVYLFGDFITKKIYGARLNDQKNGLTEMVSVAGTMPGTVSAMGQDGSGNFYAAMYKESGTPRTTHLYRLKHAELKSATVSLLQKQDKEAQAQRVQSLSIIGPSLHYQFFDLSGKSISNQVRLTERANQNDILIIRDTQTGATQKWLR